MESLTIRPLSLTNFNTSRTFSIYKPCEPFFCFVNFHKQQRPHKIPESLKIVNEQDLNLHRIHNTYKYQRANSQKDDQNSKIFINRINVKASYIYRSLFSKKKNLFCMISVSEKKPPIQQYLLSDGKFKARGKSGIKSTKKYFNFQSS